MSQVLPVLEAHGLTKRFGPTVAVRDFDLTIHAGEVVALMGANGAGKSTVVKLLSGVLASDGGSIVLRGRPYSPTSTTEAMTLGVATMHQSVADAIVPTLSIADNLLLDRTSNGRSRAFETASSRRRTARDIAAKVGLSGDLDAWLGDQSVATKQLVTLARALDTDPAVLILDEPTASLSAAEANVLFAAVDTLRQRGVGILLVSHRIGDLRRLADRAVVLRDGRCVGEYHAPLDVEAALESMIGRSLAARLHRATQDVTSINPASSHQSTQGQTESLKQGEAKAIVDSAFALEHSDASTAVPATSSLGFRAHGLKLFDDAPPIDFSASRGEIVAIAGPVGGGKSRLARTIFGTARAAAGSMTLDSVPWQARNAADAIAAGVFMLGEDRWRTSLFPDSVPFASIEGTLSFPFLGRWFRTGRVVQSRERRAARDAITHMTVRCNGPSDRVAHLSGGNQQKVALARWQIEPARMLLLDEPFQGVDVGAREEIVDVLRRTASDRITIVFVSDLEEAYEVADRVLYFDRLHLHPLTDGWMTTAGSLDHLAHC